MDQIGRRVIIGIFLMVPLSEAKATCKHDGVSSVFRTAALSWVTDDKSVCTMTMHSPDHIAKIEIDSKPQHGVAGRSGPFGVAYKPEPGFHGSDTFTFAVTSNSNYRKGAGRVGRFTVFVTVR